MYNKNNFKHAPCPTCKGKVAGRTDKVFCSVKCKNEHHRMARILIKTRFCEIKDNLRRNLIVLEGVLGTEHNRMKIHKDALLYYGFNLEIGNYRSEENNNSEFELANYVYSVDGKGIVQVKRNGNLSENMPVFFDRWLVEFPKEMKVGGNSKGKKPMMGNDEISRWNE